MARRPKKSETLKAGTQELETVSAEESQNIESDNQVLDASAIEDTSQDAQSQCGGELLAARTAQGLSVKSVAEQLRLGIKQIEALEQDHFSDLPEPTIVKGFIRNYAKLLKIPAAPLLVAYAEMMPEKEQYSFKLNPGINMKISETGQSNKARYFLLALGLLLGVGIWFFYQSYIQKPSPVNPVPEIIDALPEFALPMSERVEPATTQIEMPEADAQVPAIELNSSENISVDNQNNIDPQETTSEVNKTDEMETAETDNAPDQAATNVTDDAATVPGKTRLKFNATQETWVSVVNESGKEVYNKILYAGNREVVDLWHPAEIVVGNAHGTTLVVDGKPMDLAPYTRINVARVRLNR